METILITGGAGYLGSFLVPLLLQKKHRIIVLDKLYFGADSLSEFRSHGNFQLVNGNILEIKKYKHLIEAADKVIHLAALSNDPSCDIDSQLAVDTNYKSTIELADLCKETGVKKFLFASSCSVYGWRGNEILTEEEETNPVSLYARTKVDSEKYLQKIADKTFIPVILRMATIYGYSPRMRFDLAINIMTLNAIKNRKIHISGGGTQWRPFLHIEDAANAFIHMLEYPSNNKHAVYNVGSNGQNHSIIELAEIVQKDFQPPNLFT